MLGMSQEKLGENLGITFQQIQKYEKGTNRVGASRLQAISSILEVPVAFFFEDAPGGGEGLAVLGITLDTVSNTVRSKEPRAISTKDSSVAVLVIPTNEELQMAHEVKAVIG